MRKAILFFMLMFCMLMAEVRAADFETALDIAIKNMPAGADIAAMGNTDAASLDFSSNNPAVIGYADEKNPSQGGLSGTFGMIDFSRGPAALLYMANGQINSGYGNFQLSYSFLNSGSDKTLMGMKAQFDASHSIGLLWGKKVSSEIFSDQDELYFGLGGGYSKSQMTFGRKKDLLRSEAEGASLTAGFLYRPFEGLNLGGYYVHDFSWSQEKDLVANEKNQYFSGIDQVKVGASYQLFEMTTLAVNYQFLNLDGQTKHQVFAGVEQGIIKDILYLYGGWAGSGPTAGIGLYFKNGGVNFAYMHDPFNDLNGHLGKADVYMVSVYWNF